MSETELEQVAAWIDEGVNAARREDEAAIARIGDEVREFALGFPIPGPAV
jgi:glycine hydroxymethyltransferase